MRLLPFLPVLVVLGVVAVLRGDLLTGAAGSPRAWLVVLVVVLLATLTRRLVQRRSPALAPWASSGVVLVMLAVLLLPAFDEKTVNEAFPEVLLPAATAVPTASGTAASPVPSSAPTAAPIPSASRPASPPPAAPVAKALAGGSLRGIDHGASGRTVLYDVSGDVVLRFEKIAVQGTPKPSVHLVEQGARTPKGGLRLGALKGEKGSFSYSTPASFDRTRSWTVLIWCDTYATPIAAADLA